VAARPRAAPAGDLGTRRFRGGRRPVPLDQAGRLCGRRRRHGRAPGWAGVIIGIDPDPANAGRISQWARDYWAELHPASAGGGYVNFLMNEGQDRVKAAYRGNYDRLAQIKHRYDPDNAFHINQNIQPASGLRS